MKLKSIEKYLVKKVKDAKDISSLWIDQNNLINAISFGLPEVDDRYHIWRVPLISKISKHKIGEIVVDAMTTLVEEGKTTTPALLKERILNGNGAEEKKKGKNFEVYEMTAQRNTIAFGDAEKVLRDLAAKSADLIFTSPPYYNARPEY